MDVLPDCPDLANAVDYLGSSTAPSGTAQSWGVPGKANGEHGRRGSMDAPNSLLGPSRCATLGDSKLAPRAPHAPRAERARFLRRYRELRRGQYHGLLVYRRPVQSLRRGSVMAQALYRSAITKQTTMATATVAECRGHQTARMRLPALAVTIVAQAYDTWHGHSYSARPCGRLTG